MSRGARLALTGIGVLMLAAILVPLLSHQDPLLIGSDPGMRLVSPFSRDGSGHLHVLGTDRFGRDLFIRMMLAARLSLSIGIGGSLLASALGIALGAWAGWSGGMVDRLAMAAADVLLAFPRLILLLLVAALWRPGAGTVVFVLALTGWMGVARLVRGEVLGVRELPFVQGAAALGSRGSRLLWRHIVPNAIGPAIVATTLGVGNAILLESGLAFLGLGVQPPDPSWGNMIAGGRDLIVTAPWVAIAPGLALILTVLATTVLGDALRDRLAGQRVAVLGERA